VLITVTSVGDLQTLKEELVMSDTYDVVVMCSRRWVYVAAIRVPSWSEERCVREYVGKDASRAWVALCLKWVVSLKAL